MKYSIPFWFVLSLILFSSQLQAQCNGISEADSLELVNLYEAFNGDNWGDNSGWLVSPVKDWFGVEVKLNEEDGICYVHKVDLNGNSLDGTIPNLNLQHLSELNLRLNNILSEIPNFSQCPKLEVLNVSYNQLIGEIPNFSNLPKLKYLSLHANQLTGEISNFSNLPQLEYLFLSSNQLSGTIPDFDKIPNLKELFIRTNQLSGNIPNFNFLPSLEVLELANNQFVGTIPDFDKLLSLEGLNIRGNQLTGIIPDFTNLPKLEYLNIGGNELTGIIPDFTNLPKLELLGVGGGKLTGTIPDFNHLPNLNSLSISGENLTGGIPNFNHLPNLGFLRIIETKLNGSIPNFNKLPNLEDLILYKNVLSGDIPNFVLPQLNILMIDSNSLNGTIPDFSNMPKLFLLFMTNNQLTGTIPNFSNFPILEMLVLNNNQFTGELPPFNNLNSLLHLEARNNQLSGSIPDFQDIPQLISLVFSDNQLNGELPDFTNLSNLSTLALDNNKFTGTIPDFTNLSSLQYLFLGMNQLTGNIPDFSNLPNLEQLSIGDNQLSGSLFNFTNLPALEILKACPNNLLGFVPNFDSSPLFNFEASELECFESGIVTGIVFHDENNNCVYDEDESTVSNAKITINDSLYHTFADDNGFYKLQLDTGTYEITITPPNLLWSQNCPVNPNSYTVTLESYNDSIPNKNFGLEIEDECTLLTIDITTPFLRRCFSNSYTVHYCNEGTKSADSTYIELTFPPDIIPSEASIPFVQNRDVWSFDLDTLAIGECGSFTVEYFVDCEALLGSTSCVEAHIYPAFLCKEINTLWDGSDIIVEGECVDSESIKFSITNIGEDMQDSIEYRIYEDDILSSLDKVKLMQNVSEELHLPATGATYRLKAEQSEFHPFESIPQAIVELCGEQPFSLGFVTSQSNSDLEHFIDIDCQPIIGAYDPNDKTVHPVGISDQHYIEEGTELTYKIRFQNTGSDTAFTVTIVDTIQHQYLDLQTFQITNASHSYEAQITNQNVLIVHFNNILLPDSTANEPESHGFIEYKIKTFQDAPTNSTVTNLGDIYFDYNAPITTNTVFNTIGIPQLDPNLPFDLLQFDAYWGNNQEANLTWISTSEIDNIYFEVQRSIDGENFEAIGGLKGKGAMTMPNLYEFTDNNLASNTPNYLYRLKQIDFNGQSIYSKIVSLSLQNESSVILRYQALQSQIEVIAKETLQLQIFDATGRLVQSANIIEGRQTIGTESLASGVYAYQLLQNGSLGSLQTGKLMIAGN